MEKYLTGWRRLRKGSNREVVLTVHFGPAQAEAGFADLAFNLSTHRSVLETIPPTTGTYIADAANPALYIQYWLDEIERCGLVVRGILGYCAGAVFACALRDAIEATDPPVTVLLDPSPVTTDTLHTQFATAIENLEGPLTSEEVATAREASYALTRHVDDLAAVANNVVGSYERLVRLAFVRSGVTGRLADELCHRFQTYYAYLTAAGRAMTESRGPLAAVIVSRDHELTTEYSVRCERFTTPRAQLLADPDVAKRVSEAIE